MSNNSPKNYAPLEQEGYYTVYVKDNLTIVTKHQDRSPRPLKHGDKQEVVKCHPDDKFDIGEAMRIGVKRIHPDDIIRIGDTVQVANCGKSYSTIRKWPIEYYEYAIRYRYGVHPEDGTIGKVVGKFEDKYIVQVEKEHSLGVFKYNHLNCYDSVYLLSIDGLNKIKDWRYE